jgi:catecholate siderophore receptor
MIGNSYCPEREIPSPSADARSARLIRFCTTSAAGIATLAPAMSLADTDPTSIETVDVTGQRISDSTNLDKLPTSIQNTAQSIEAISQQTIQEQSSTRLQDALRYAPGVTLNSGEGGAHGDNVNLRGLQSIDSFFIDGIRDPGSYARDSFDTETINVLEGPSAILFGNGPAGGIVNQVSKAPSLAPVREATIEAGTNTLFRGTADVDQPIGTDAAVRLNLMGEKSDVADRDVVQNKRWGVAPSIALGLNEPTRFTLSYFHQEEDDIPDYGVPFLFGQPADVPRQSFYGLKNYDSTETNVNIMTAKLAHDFNDNLSVSDTVRYANYFFVYRVSAPHFGDDFVGGAPAPGTPLDQILVYRDRPSSQGTQTYLTNHTDLIARFDTGGLSHILVTGVEEARQTSDVARFNNDFQGIDGTPPTPLLGPNPDAVAPVQTDIDARPSETADSVGVYAIDTVQLTPQWSLNLGARFDRYDTSANDPLSNEGFERTDTAWSPRAAIEFKPSDGQNFYFSYSTSFDPAVSYLTLAPDSTGQPPETAKTYEVGAKTQWLGGLLFVTASAFRTETENALVSDPDDPTLQEMPGNHQRVQGIELSATGHINERWEVSANYTYLSPKITGSATPGEIGRVIPNTARNIANLWTEYELSDDWEIGTGVNYVGHRYADNANTQSLPSFALWNGMVSYQVNDDVKLQMNAFNITNENYYTGSYYSDPTENHALPGAGRSVSLTLSTQF